MKDTIDNLLGALINEIEWSVQIPGSPLIDRAKQNKAKSEIKQALLEDMLRLIGEDEEIPMENRMSDVEQVKLFNQVAKAVYGRNALRTQLRQEITNYFKGGSDE